MSRPLDQGQLRAIVDDARPDDARVYVSKRWLKQVAAELAEIPHMRAELAGVRSVEAVTQTLLGDRA